jgi:hypothetical protein
MNTGECGGEDDCNSENVHVHFYLMKSKKCDNIVQKI